MNIEAIIIQLIVSGAGILPVYLAMRSDKNKALAAAQIEQEKTKRELEAEKLKAAEAHKLAEEEYHRKQNALSQQVTNEIAEQYKKWMLECEAKLEQKIEEETDTHEQLATAIEQKRALETHNAQKDATIDRMAKQISTLETEVRQLRDEATTLRAKVGELEKNQKKTARNGQR